MNFRTAASKAADYRRKQDGSMEDKVKNLRMDLMNIPSHEFGEHSHCLDRGYFCAAEPGSDPANLVPALTASGLYALLIEEVKNLSRHSRSLIANVTSNPAEHYNSIVAKYIGGKRINFALRGSYQGRCSGAVLQYNSGNTHYLLHKKMCESSPGIYSKSTGIKRKRKVDRQKGKKRSRKCLFRSSNKPDEDYGPAAQKPDLEEDLMAEETDEFMRSLQKTEEERKKLERETVEQSNSGVWLQTRRNLLTASNYGRVCKMKPTTGCGPFVKQLLYSTFDCEAMAYGRSHEDTARQHLERELETTIQPCGLFIHPQKMFLGATPDGLLGADGLVEIKCPSSAKNMTPDEAIISRKVTFWKSQDGKIGDINRTHNYYYQVQGQLGVTGREFCVFALWTPKGLKTEKIKRDDEFWNSMIIKLERFYMNCVVPEIVDPRHRRSMPIRNPMYIIEAQDKAKSKKNSQSQIEPSNGFET
ncbi:uncharacterized protein LOC129001999 [Macrosteles quadrilineatus]|uniref:uncharacterized protein LOC129001999 n=1 Tax=Macrosteles quadrilineatus TaxID=74068 RepID=UPI0023E2BE3D|nr:uncharacterized protein LOC129001999 [Macrosteles quadrilineatus]